MRLILGLGNPGPDYRESRHNLGFRVVEELARRHGLRLDTPFCGALTGRTDDLLLASPQTYMNRSGLAARCLVEQEGTTESEILVVFDDVALALGRLRLREQGGPGGHRGLASILEHLRTDSVPRLRLGIGPPPVESDLADWVLDRFGKDELGRVTEMVSRAADACEAWTREPWGAVASRFNALPAGEPVDGAASD